MDTVLQGISGVKCIIDDMIITGSSEKEYLRNMEAVLTRLDEYNVRVNLNKCKFFIKRVSYCVHEIDSQGLHKSLRLRLLLMHRNPGTCPVYVHF